MSKMLKEEESMYIKWGMFFLSLFLISIKWSMVICQLLEWDSNLLLPSSGIPVGFAITIWMTIIIFSVIYSLVNYIFKTIAYNTYLK